MRNLKPGRIAGTAMATWAVLTPLALFALVWCILPMLTAFLEWLGQF